MTTMLPSDLGSATFGAAEVAATSAAPHALDVPNEALVYEISLLEPPGPAAPELKLSIPDPILRATMSATVIKRAIPSAIS
jgi:hypothetical protein